MYPCRPCPRNAQVNIRHSSQLSFDVHDVELRYRPGCKVSVLLQVIRHRTSTGIREEPDWELKETHYRVSGSWLDAASRSVSRPAAIAVNTLAGEEALLPCGVDAKTRWGAEPDAASEDEWEDPWNGDTRYSECETTEAEEPRDRRRASVKFD